MIAATLAFVLAAQHQHMPGMAMPAPRPRAVAKPRAAAKPKPRVRQRRLESDAAVSGCTPEHAAMGHCALLATSAPAEAGAHSDGRGVRDSGLLRSQEHEVEETACTPEHAAMGHCTLPAAAPAATGPAGTDLPAGDAPAPAAPRVGYADRVWGAEAMQASRAQMYREHGGGRWSQLMLNLAEVQVRDGRDGLRWDGEYWYGGDRDRLVLKSEGRTEFGRGVEDAEVQALYSRAVGPYFNLQGGVRQDFGPGPSRTYLSLGTEGLAPYWFDVEATAFLSDRGGVFGRLEGYYDQRITQRLILQPRAELNFALQDDDAIGVGRGVSDLELGLRLRYEFKREFAPYVGVSWDRRFGGTARAARAAGEDASAASLVAGIRVWF